MSEPVPTACPVAGSTHQVALGRFKRYPFDSPAETCWWELTDPLQRMRLEAMRWFVLLVVIGFTWHGARVMAQNAVADVASTPESGETAPQANEENVEAKEGDSETARYIRVNQSDDKQPKSLQTAIVRYRGKKDSDFKGRIVDLVGVVHIGDEQYYADLNQRLAKYDSVLYELVAPDGTRIKPEDLEKRRSVLASMQSGMKDMLNLEYQLEKIDYLAENFRHADMSPDEFVEDLERRGDSIFKMFARMMGAGLASQSATGGDAGMLLALFSRDRPMLLKQTFAKQLIDIELVTAGMDDANGDNTLIRGRNAKAFSILREELDSGKKKIAVFYGAGHLPDMAERLEQDFGFEARRTTWLDAWDLTRN